MRPFAQSFNILRTSTEVAVLQNITLFCKKSVVKAATTVAVFYSVVTAIFTIAMSVAVLFIIVQTCDFQLFIFIKFNNYLVGSEFTGKNV